MEIGPGESVDLTMAVDSQPVYRDWVVDCSLDTDDPEFPLWSYRLKFRTYPGAQFEVATVDLGPIDRSSKAETSKVAWLEFYEPVRGRTSRLPTPELECRSPVVVKLGRESDVEWFEKGTVRRTRRPVSVSIDPQSVLEGPSGTLTQTLTARSDRETIASAVVTWSWSAPIAASPSNLSFGIVKTPGEESPRRVLLHSRDKRPFRVLSVTGGADAVASRIDPDSPRPGEPSPNHLVQLTFTRGENPRKFGSGQALVQTDHPEMPQVRVLWSVIQP